MRQIFPAGYIVSIAQSLRGGGVERALLRLCAGWIAEGRRVTLLVGDRAGPLAAELPERLDIVEIGSATMPGMLARVPGLVAQCAPDVIFCPGNHYTAVAAAIRVRLGAQCPPIVGKVSNALVRRDQAFPIAQGYRFWLRQHARFLDHVVAMTPAMADEARTMLRLPAARVSVIANPPALPIAGAAPVALPQGRFLVGVGRLVAQKRWDRLIAALPRLADRDIRLLILGEGDARPQLEAQVERLGLGARVTLAGHAADPLPAIAAACALVLVSDYEGVPGVLREALALGTPVVATKSSVAVREIVASPALGDVVAPDDADALVAALNRWLRPDAVRPAPVHPPGTDAAAEYLAVFDRVVARHRQ